MRRGVPVAVTPALYLPDMATSSRGAAARQSPAEWVLVLTKGGLYQGMVGPFPSLDDAESWAARVLKGQRSWTWRTEPVVSPESLPEVAPPAGAPGGRPRLSVVR